MKLAVTYEDGNVFQHFGKCQNFSVYEIQQKEIINKQIINSNGISHGALAKFLKENSVDTLICGGIGDGAKQALQSENIQIVAGAIGNADIAVENYLNGKLVNDESFKCDHSGHGDNHENHNCGGKCSN